MKKKSILLLAVLAFSSIAYSQTGSASSLNNALGSAANDVKVIANGLTTLLNIIAGLVAFFGIFRVYSKYQNGDQDTNKAIAQFGGAFVFLIAASFAVKAFFGL